MDLAGHVDDLLGVVAALPGAGPVTAVGHSFGGDVVVAAALAEPTRFASVGAYEPPMPWLGLSRRPGRAPWVPGDPGDEAEAFFRRMVGDATWDRLPAEVRAERRAEGPALVADLLAIARRDALRRHRAGRAGGLRPRAGRPARPTTATRWPGWPSHVPGAVLVEIEGAGHGAHLSHPDGFARLVRVAVGLGTAGQRRRDPATPGAPVR